jgi:hypothetical protein
VIATSANFGTGKCTPTIGDEQLSSKHIFLGHKGFLGGPQFLELFVGEAKLLLLLSEQFFGLFLQADFLIQQRLQSVRKRRHGIT